MEKKHAKLRGKIQDKKEVINDLEMEVDFLNEAKELTPEKLQELKDLRS